MHSGIKDVVLEFPENEAFGDYSSNVAFRAKVAANEVVEKLQKDKELARIVGKIEVAGHSFINFWLKKEVLVQNLADIEKKGEGYGKSDMQRGKKLMFEFAHPNTHKAFHIGHLRNITTGESLARLTEFTGAEVIRVNYQGDVGLHIAKAIWGIQKLGFSNPGKVKSRAEFLGKAYAAGATAYEGDGEAKEKINELNKKIYSKEDPGINKIYEETRKWSLDYFAVIYERVYAKFDRFYFESECAENGKQIALEALKKGILAESEGAIIFPGSEYGLHDRVFITGQGAPTYEAKDLGLARLQFGEYNPDLILHVVGPEQSGYFQVIFKALELILPETKDREVHIPYGWVRLKEGKMSSRTGNVVLGESLLDDAKSSIKKSFDTMDETAEKIAVAAVKYSFLKNGLGQDIAFDLKESVSLEGNSGPYLQYTVARANSVLAKAKIKKGETKAGGDINEEELKILRSLVRFSEVIETAAKNYSPNLLCNYLYDLAQKFNTFYNKYRIIDSDNEQFRLVLTQGTGQVLENGLKLLGIQSPEKM